MQFFEKVNENSSQREQLTKRLLISSGTWYGVLFGLSFVLFTWGYDAFQLASSSATLVWAKLVFGFPIVMVVVVIVGRFVATSPNAGVFVIVWTIVGWLLGTVAGHLPFDGGNLWLGVLDQRLWGEAIYSFDTSASVRTTLVVITTTILGAFTGFLESMAVEWAWDRAKDDRLSLGSFIALGVSVPMAFLMALAVNQFINQPLRIHQLSVSQLIGQAEAGAINETDSNYRTIAPFIDQLSDQYEVHFVAFGGDETSWYSAYVDVIFDDGFMLRCATSGENVIYCDDFSEKFNDWMGELARAGLYGEQPWLDARVRHLSVDNTVLAWLESHQNQLSENYEIALDNEQNGWIFMSMKFDTGFEMLCRFHDAAPIIVDQCTEVDS